MTALSRTDTRKIHLLEAQPARKLQVGLGGIWLIDSALQLQPFMFGRSFVTQVIAPNEVDQPTVIAAPIRLVVHLMEPRVALFNLFAITIQVLIGVGLMYRRTVKAALLTSFAWSLGVWWIGEGLGGLLTGHASPLTGAPGAALLYVLVGLIAWPRPNRGTGTAGVGGILGERGARTAWALLWLGSAALWLLPANRADAAVHNAIANAPSGARWLASIQATVAATAVGHGLAIALGAAGVSAAVGVAVLFARGEKTALVLSIAIGLVWFVVGQGMGGILTGSGTDPGTGPLIILFSIAIYSLPRTEQRWPGATAKSPDGPRPRPSSRRDGAEARPDPSEVPLATAGAGT